MQVDVSKSAMVLLMPRVAAMIGVSAALNAAMAFVHLLKLIADLDPGFTKLHTNPVALIRDRTKALAHHARAMLAGGKDGRRERAERHTLMGAAT